MIESVVTTHEALIAAILFVCLLVTSLASAAIYRRLPARHRDDDSLNVVRMIASIFVVMTSLVLGFLISSAKTTLETVDRNVHALATGLIVLDRSLEFYGAEADVARQHLQAYAQHAARTLDHWDTRDEDRQIAQRLGAIAASMKALRPADADQRATLQSAQQQFVRLVELQWLTVGESRGTIPTPLVIMVGAWLMLVFASYGCRAPRNLLVAASFIVASLLLSAAIYLILDMDRPFSGAVRVSADPLLRAAAEMQR